MKGQRDRLLMQRWRIMAWGLSSSAYHIKLIVIVLIILSTALLARRASSIMGWEHRLDEQPQYETSRNRYTVVINTWKRNDLLRKSVAHYATCKAVDAIRVVWSEPVPPSSELHLALLNSVAAKSRKHNHRLPKFQFDINEEDNLNNRFKPIEGLNTEAIFSVDDDILIPCKTMEFAFGVWSSARHSMVGFVPRMHWVERNKHVADTRYRYGGWWSVWWTGTYSMILSKASFFHREYLDMYTNRMPAVIRNYVASQRNCEDIAMSFLVANATGAPPVWVKGPVDEIGASGISSLTGHNSRRTRCLNYFTSEFGNMPLVATNVKAVDARHEWWW